MNDEHDHIATGAESLQEFAFNAGMDRPEDCWLLDDRDVYVRNPHYTGPDQPHPEDDCHDYEPVAPEGFEQDTPLGEQIEQGGEIDDCPF